MKLFDKNKKYTEKIEKISKIEPAAGKWLKEYLKRRDEDLTKAKNSHGLDKKLFELEASYYHEAFKKAIELYPLDVELLENGRVNDSDPKYKNAVKVLSEQVRKINKQCKELGNSMIETGEQSNNFNQKLLKDLFDYATGGYIYNLNDIREYCLDHGFAGALDTCHRTLLNGWYQHYHDLKIENYKKESDSYISEHTHSDGTISGKFCVDSIPKKLEEHKERKLEVVEKSKENSYEIKWSEK